MGFNTLVSFGVLMNTLFLMGKTIDHFTYMYVKMSQDIFLADTQSISLATAKVNARDICKDTNAHLLTFSENVLIKTRERERT